MGGTGLEPVTPSLSSKYADSDDVRLSPIFPAHEAFPLALKHQHLNAAGTVCASFVRRAEVAGSQPGAMISSWGFPVEPLSSGK
jgi:hypothetical protein